MYSAPALHIGHLDDLITLVGGDAAACRLLDITPRTLRRWRAHDYPPPQMALKLLWYASPWGQQAAEVDLFNEVRILRLLTNSLDRQTKLPVEADRFLAQLLAPPAACPECSEVAESSRAGS